MIIFLFFFLIKFNVLYTNNSITNEIIKLLNKNLPKDAKYSLTCFSTSKKEYLIRINSDIPLIPASTNKLFTSGIALLTLGADYSINTEVYCDDSNLNDSIINGNLYLKGYGDPTLTNADLITLAKKIKEIGIKAITGNIITDDTFFEGTFLRNEWIEDENISVPLPLISAITVDKNSIYLRVTGSSKLNKPAIIDLENNLDYFKFINTTKTTKNKTRIFAKSNFENGKEIITIGGNIRRNTTTNVLVHLSNPSLYAGHLLSKHLRENGISFWGEIKKGKTKKFSNRLAVIETPLVELIKPINKNSNNFFAEHLYLILGAQYSGGNGSPFDASKAINTFLKSINIYNNDVNIVDGSGISRNNQFSTEVLVKFLYHIYLNPLIYNEFHNSLSIPQVDGTLFSRFGNLYSHERLRGKTGTLNGVTALAGYVVSKSGDLLIFSINFNYSRGSQLKMRGLQDKIITLIADNF